MFLADNTTFASFSVQNYQSLLSLQVVHHVHEILRLNLIELQLVNYDKLVLLNLGGQNGLECQSLLLLVQADGVISRVSARILRRRPSTGELSLNPVLRGPVPFCLQGFLPPPGHFRTGLCLLRSLTLICKLRYNRHVYQVLVHIYTEYSIVQLDCANFISFSYCKQILMPSVSPPFR